MMLEDIECPRCSSTDVIYSKKYRLYICEDCQHRFPSPQAKVSHRIFLSYGHDESSQVAARLMEDLLGQGHEVWFDVDRLGPGVDYEAHIEAGLEWAAHDPWQGLVLFLMTPHSCRRPDGYCLNELTRALARGLAILPVMLVWCEPPLSICRLQWLDFRDCIPLDSNQDRYANKFQRLCEALAHARVDQEGLQARLLHYLEPLPFENEVQRNLLEFSGRQWIFAKMETWLKDSKGRRIFWIIGKPGVGKTTIAAWLCSYRPEVAAFHLCVFGHTQKSDPRKCVLSIAYQLSSQLPEYQARLASLNLEQLVPESNAKTLFDQLIVQPLSRNFPAPDHPVVILIDALDEATEGGVNHLASFLASEFGRTPEWLRLIVTSRPDPEVRHPLQAFTPYELDTSEPENAADIRLFLGEALKPFCPDGKLSAPVLDAICNRSENLFLYAHCIVEELRQGRLSLDHLEDFPQGLGGYYARFCARQFPAASSEKTTGTGDLQAYRTLYRPMLEIVAAAREPLPAEQIAALLQWDDYAQSTARKLFGSFLIEQTGRLQPFHRSLVEWLTDPLKAGDYFVSVKHGHQALAKDGWREYQKGFEGLSPYYRLHLAAHLITAGHWEDLKILLVDPAMMREFMTEDKQYLLTEYWLAAGSSLDMGEVYREAVDKFADLGIPEAEALSLLLRVAGFLRLNARYSQALFLAQKALALAEKVWGLKHPDTAEALGKVALIYQEQGQYPEAESLMAKSLAILEEVLPPDHPQTATVLQHLARLYELQGLFSKAEAFYQHSLAIFEKDLGSDQQDLALILNGLGRLYLNQGRYVEAESLYQRSLAIREKSLGPEHPDVSTSLNNLAVLYQTQGRYLDAEPLYQHSLAIREKALGPEHPYVATCLNNLAVLYQTQGRYMEAEALHRRSLSIREKVLGPEHLDVGSTFDNLALLYRAQGRYNEAEPLHQQSLAIREKILGPEHPLVGKSLNNLAVHYQHLGRYAEAEALQRRSLSILEKALGPKHPDVAASLHNLADLCHVQGRYLEAEPLYQRSLAIREKVLGSEHPEVAQSLNNLAELFQAQNLCDEAKPLFLRARDIFKKNNLPLEAAEVELNLQSLFNLSGQSVDLARVKELTRILEEAGDQRAQKGRELLAQLEKTEEGN